MFQSRAAILGRAGHGHCLDRRAVYWFQSRAAILGRAGVAQEVAAVHRALFQSRAAILGRAGRVAAPYQLVFCYCFNRGRRFWGGLAGINETKETEMKTFQSRAAILGRAGVRFSVARWLVGKFQSRAAILGRAGPSRFPLCFVPFWFVPVRFCGIVYPFWRVNGGLFGEFCPTG